MRSIRIFLPAIAAGMLSLGIASAQTAEQKVSGEAVYKQRCAGCHEQINPRIPPRTALSQMPAQRILRALDFGAMMTVARSEEHTSELQSH